MTPDSNGRLDSLNGDERAVSPVVGVALLIAITVILAAVIGFVVLDTTDAETASSTDARLDFSYDESSNTLTVKHEGGDSIDASNLAVVTTDDSNPTLDTATIGSDFETGEAVKTGIGDVDPGEEVSIVYVDPNSDRRTTLGTFEV